MATTTKTRKATKELITAPVINRAVSLETGKCLGYLIKSNSTDAYYQVTWSRERKAYQCNCAATVKCCHIKALEQVLAAKKEIARATNLCNFFEALATYEQEEIAKQAVAEAEQAVQPAQRYCDACSCVGKLQQVDGLQLCPTCAENTRPAPIQTPASVATKPVAKTKTARGNTALGTGGSFKMVNGIPMR